jgi:microcystin-dependent protein
MDWPAATEPPTADGDLVMWLELAGQTVQRSAFPELAAAWGINAATFALPNRSGRAPVGAGTGAGLTTRTVGQTFGSEVHWLTAAQSGVNGNGATAAADLPRAQPAYGGVIGGYANSVYANPGYTAVAYFGGGNEGANGNGIHAHGLVARNADQSHPIVQPSIVTRYFVRAR